MECNSHCAVIAGDKGYIEVFFGEEERIMFCFKCGTKAIDGAAFCQKCGAKLIQDNRDERQKTVQEADIYEEACKPDQLVIPNPTDNPKALGEVEHCSNCDFEQLYQILEADTAMCYGVKSAKLWKQGISIQGRTHMHYVNITNVTAKIRSNLSVPFSLINWVLYLLGG